MGIATLSSPSLLSPKSPVARGRPPGTRPPRVGFFIKISHGLKIFNVQKSPAARVYSRPGPGGPPLLPPIVHGTFGSSPIILLKFLFFFFSKRLSQITRFAQKKWEICMGFWPSSTFHRKFLCILSQKYTPQPTFA